MSRFRSELRERDEDVTLTRDEQANVHFGDVIVRIIRRLERAAVYRQYIDFHAHSVSADCFSAYRCKSSSPSLLLLLPS